MKYSFQKPAGMPDSVALQMQSQINRLEQKKRGKVRGIAKGFRYRSRLGRVDPLVETAQNILVSQAKDVTARIMQR